ncbi:MAG: hypothetical protein N2C14_28185 [Planctomycetales bacterium]
MNFFAHGRRFLDDPYFVAGTAIPDWLNVADRKVRVRSKHAEPFADSTDPAEASLARGIKQHHFDDRWFHETRAFVELSWRFSSGLREILPEEDGHRRGFVGHILVELLLDSVLAEDDPQSLEKYYATLEQVDPQIVEDTVNRMALRSTDRLASLIKPFLRERFLWDYSDDAKLGHRLNQVMRRVRLPQLPEAFRDFLSLARKEVRERSGELLTPDAPSPTQADPIA